MQLVMWQGEPYLQVMEAVRLNRQSSTLVIASFGFSPFSNMVSVLYRPAHWAYSTVHDISRGCIYCRKKEERHQGEDDAELSNEGSLCW